MSKKERKLFGTDGIRGVANTFPMTGEVAMKLGRALVTVLLRKSRSASPKIIVGKDTRLSGYMLENALTSGITSMGGTALLLGPLPTPAVAYMIKAMRAQGGVMISASHNPYQDNGLKVFGEDGFKLADSLEAELEHLMVDEEEVTSVRPRADRLGRARRIDDARGRYLTNLKTLFSRDFDLTGFKIAFDGAHGAAYEVGPSLFKELGAEVSVCACAPDGTNINQNCAQSDIKTLGRFVVETKSDIGIGVDGDADRLLLVDETGQAVSGEHLLYAMATFLKSEGRLSGNAVVTTIMSNQALEEALRKQNIKMHRTQVGDRYVLERMQKDSLILGGENSGHFLFLDQSTCGDGLFASLEVLALLHKQGWKASKLREAFELYPQKLKTIKVKERVPLETLPKLNSAIQSLEKKYEKSGRVNVRYSGTEVALRVMIEGPEASKIEADIESLAQLALKEIGG